MKNEKLKTWTRILLIICGLALIPVLFIPMWRIELSAPQYPEGLRLLIYPGKLGGDVDIVNGLNHYIGMKTLHAKDFIEFTLLPYFIGFFALLFLLTGIIAKRKLLNILTILFVAFCFLAMIDFWRWEYDYGHNLNPDAAIVVPGMAYQPPLIGFKQLLNFGAYSIPAPGGWIFASVAVVLIFCMLMAWKSGKEKNIEHKLATVLVSFALLLCMGSCNKGPEKIITGTDNCYSCKMTMSDPRFGAEVITGKGKIYKFDDTHCLFSFLHSGFLKTTDISDIYLSDFTGDHQLLDVKHCLLINAEDIRGPMGGTIAAFNNADSLKKIQEHYKGALISWSEIYKP